MNVPLSQQQEPHLQKVWYLLAQLDGTPFKDCTLGLVVLPQNAVIADIQKAVKTADNDCFLRGIPSNGLKVFKDKDSLKGNPLSIIQAVENLGETEKEPLFVLVPNISQNDLVARQSIAEFLALPLGEVAKDEMLPEDSGSTRRAHPKMPAVVTRWETFKQEAANFSYPTNPKPDDVYRIPVSCYEITSEKGNLNRIFAAVGDPCIFRNDAKLSSYATAIGSSNGYKTFIGKPDNYLCDSSKYNVLAIVEDKSPWDLPVKDSAGNCYDLLQMYNDDKMFQGVAHCRENIGRNDVVNVV